MAARDPDRVVRAFHASFSRLKDALDVIRILDHADIPAAGQQESLGLFVRSDDVPDFTDELVDLIAGQSDEQSGKYSIRELERIRDDNLVSMMRALKARDWGAGALLKAHDEGLKPAAGLTGGIDAVGDLSQPILTLARAVPIDWTDYNGHMTESRYLDAFAQSTDRFMEIIGCDSDYIAALEHGLPPARDK